MKILEMLLKEMNQEAETTQKMLKQIPDDKYDWRPHTKSMTIRQLATHIAELPTWVKMILTSPELDFASNPYHPVVINSTAELLTYAQKCLEEGTTSLAAAKESQLDDTWALREGDIIYQKTSKAEFIRITFSQIVHHRAQMGVYLRLLDIPIPGSYGPSADEQGF
ncbi:MAG: DinB family protein [Bacteroidetes bacterium]|nr:DinB family protein [Bacteroidota bacterium]MBL0138626.1 DinB family protein [Bacteroidota bacterium]